MSDLSNKVNLSDGDKVAANKLINEVRKQPEFYETIKKEPFQMPFGILGVISLAIIIIAIIVTFI